MTVTLLSPLGPRGVDNPFHPPHLLPLPSYGNCWGLFENVSTKDKQPHTLLTKDDVYVPTQTRISLVLTLIFKSGGRLPPVSCGLGVTGSRRDWGRGGGNCGKREVTRRGSDGPALRWRPRMLTIFLKYSYGDWINEERHDLV